MPQPRRHLPIADTVVGDGLAAIRRELDVPDSFPPEVQAAARSLRHASAAGRIDRRDLPMVTVDPPGATDLDQALTIERTGRGGHIVWYAIADVAAFVRPGDPIDLESRRRGVTLYAPDRRIPLHPPELSEDAASLLPDRDRPAVLWRLALDPDGMLVDTTVGRATIRSREQLTYAEAQARIDHGDELLAPIATVGRQRQRVERARGGVSLAVPEQEVDRIEGRYRLAYRASLPVEEWNAQLSLLCGMAAADLMLANGWGLLRTLPPATHEALDLLRRHAVALGIPWPVGMAYGDVVRGLDPSRAAHAALLVQATRLFRGAGYQPIRPGSAPSGTLLVHAAIASPYAHVTAPLRRLGDRFATEAVLSVVHGAAPPPWVRGALGELPGELAAGSSRASALERAVVAHLEALVLADRIGEVFPAVVVDHRNDRSVLQFHDPAIVADVAGELPLGAEVAVRVVASDPVARDIELELVG